MWKKAKVLLQKCLEGQRELLGKYDKQTLQTTSQLGQLHFARAEHAEAQPLLETALAGHRKLLGHTHQDTLADMAALGRLLFLASEVKASHSGGGGGGGSTRHIEVGEAGGAQPLLEEALVGRRKTLGALSRTAT